MGEHTGWVYNKCVCIDEYIYIYTWLSQKVCNIFVYESLWCIYHMTEVVQLVDGTCGW